MTDSLSASERAKRAAAAGALADVKSGMRLGIGTGSTAAWVVKLLGERVRAGELDVVCAPTSSRTRDLALECGLKLAELDDIAPLDLTIDGADEFDGAFNLIKGGGGALLQEKIVACASKRMTVITDPTKEVAQLGAFPLPVEIIRFGWRTTIAAIERALEGMDVAGRHSSLRLNRDDPFLTDEGHYIVDLHLRRIGDPARLAARLAETPGVVEHGLFIGVADKVVIGLETGEARIVDKNPVFDGADGGDADE